MKLKTISPIILFSLFIAGCASIMSGTTQQITFQSTPDGATVKVNGKPLGKTPLTIQLDKEKNQSLTIEKEGYKTFTTSMDTKLDPWFWGNIVLGGVIGSTTDGINGSMNEYAPGQYIITLEPISVSYTGATMHLSEKENAKRFLFINYKKLREELSKNSGEYIETALNILNIQTKDRTAAINDIKKIMFTHNDPADFVNITINKYLNKRS